MHRLSAGLTLSFEGGGNRRALGLNKGLSLPVDTREELVLEVHSAHGSLVSIGARSVGHENTLELLSGELSGGLRHAPYEVFEICKGDNVLLLKNWLAHLLEQVIEGVEVLSEQLLDL